ncbi:MAG: NAD(P)-binding domain-containing protein [Rikenellaceae bacterium]|jgi:glycerol-3-phosphate dehydrogenase (NAD(P)+)|nr:NAD(P)-binding domain-containing protein [Rikenellaceae bacterium]
MPFHISKHAKWAVVGHGSWATALVKIITEGAGHCGWYVRNPEVLDHVRKHGSNPKYSTGIRFASPRPDASGDINKVIRHADVVVLACPSAFLKTTLEGLTEPLKDKFVISAIKGIVTPENVTVAEWVNETYGVPFSQIGILTGPCHAEEVALNRLSYLTMVCTEPANSAVLAGRLASDYIRVSCSTDIYGIEYASVIKNIYAIAVGTAVGLGYGDNFLAVLISNANTEMDRFLAGAFPAERNVSASAYLGDLLVTSYSQFSRNRTLGVMIGRGYPVAAAQAEMKMVAEGYYAAACIQGIAHRYGIEMPISEMVYKILYRGAAAGEQMQILTGKLI